MKFKHTHRPGFWLGFIDFFTAGLFFFLYMPLGGLQDELDEILGRRTQRYWVAYLLGVPTAFIYPLVWMSQIAEEMKLQSETQLPIFILADTFNRVMFCSQGYTIGLGEQLIKVIGNLDK